MAVLEWRLYEQPAGTTPVAPSFTLLKPATSCPSLLAASRTAAKHSSSAAPRRPAEHARTSLELSSRTQCSVGRGGSVRADNTRPCSVGFPSLRWTPGDATPSSVSIVGLIRKSCEAAFGNGWGRGKTR
eukprot:scaffold6847_cov64-Phaeocystis_antarctica.AAC.9